VVLGWGRAILLQLAHPKVAAGVADHSAFRSGPGTAAVRLHQTVRAMLSLTFGDERAYAQTIDMIRTIHRRVNGRLREPVASFPAGEYYSAEDPDLLLWVHATLIESVVLVYDAVVGPLDEPARDAYCAEARRVAIDLGAREDEVPRTWAALLAWLDRTYRSGVIAVGTDAHHVAGAVLAPPMSFLIWPARSINRTVTVGLLPGAIREQYGFSWTSRDVHRLDRALRRVRAFRRRLPRSLAWWADARREDRRG
jgi:uncharacterized protein (DUF2236 family)